MTKIIEINDLENLSISKIKKVLVDNNYEVSDELLNMILSDKRQGVKNLGKSITIMREKEKSLVDKYQRLSIYESAAKKNGYKLVAGIDEVGRGPLAGPVVAAMVILNPDKPIYGLDDSKKLSQVKRENLFDEIMDKALAISIGIVDNMVIDKINILNATYRAMEEAINTSDLMPDLLLVDAIKLKNINIDQINIIKGDAKSNSIAAASIVAKVTRDRMMVDYDKMYPGYNFSQNKGYGTSDHYSGLEKYGPCNIHRLSFIHV